MACSETYTKSNSAEDDKQEGTDDDDLYGSDFIPHSSRKVREEDALRSEASYVDKMNFFELSDMCKSLDIGIPKSEEDCKQRLKNHLFSGQRREVHSQKMLNMVQKTIKKYKDKKKMLIDQYSKGTNIIRKAIFVQEMQKGMEERIENFAQKLGKGTKELNELSDEFEIVIIGETSSGKSTFLNVLLEEDILPWHLLHTTSCLCRLHNSVQRRLEFTAKKGSVKKTIAIKEPNELSKTLRELMKSVNQHDKSLDVMDIYWPIPWLQQNVVLVDTPGIGEKNDLTKLIIEYVPKAAGYIFVVDTSNAGGVKEGGIVQLIEGIKLSADKTGSKIKDMSNLLFVFNKWDLVGRENIEEVSQNIQEKLHQYCDPLQDWQVVVFDAKTELKIQKLKANPTKNFEIIVGRLEELMIQTIERRLRQKFQWILSFSTVLRDIVDARLNALLMTDTELHEKVEKSKKSLEDASHTLELGEVIKGLVRQKGVELEEKLQLYFNSPPVQKELSEWSENVPSFSNLEQDGLRILQGRIRNVVLKWAREKEGSFEEASTEVADRCRNIESDIDSSFRSADMINFSFFKEESISSTIRFKRFVVVLKVIFFPFLLITSSIRDFSVKIMESVTNKVLEDVSRKELHTFISCSFTDPWNKQIEEFKKKTKRKINASHQILRDVQEDRKRKSDIQSKLDSFKKEVVEAFRCLQDWE